jgi:hypothetical protein
MPETGGLSRKSAPAYDRVRFVAKERFQDGRDYLAFASSKKAGIDPRKRRTRFAVPIL